MQIGNYDKDHTQCKTCEDAELCQEVQRRLAEADKLLTKIKDFLSPENTLAIEAFMNSEEVRNLMVKTNQRIDIHMPFIPPELVIEALRIGLIVGYYLTRNPPAPSPFKSEFPSLF